MEDTGYIRSLPWEVTYHAALHPRHVRLMLAMAGIETEAARSCCELAYGQGLTLVLHAACNQDLMWSGTDFNPQHAARATALQGNQPLSNLHLRDQAIAAFCRAMPVTDYDLITCTGTWSWLPESNQSAIAAFANRHLTARGVLAFDHMTLPGQATATSLRHLLLTLAAHIPEPRSADWPNKVIDEALAICETQPRFFHARDGLRDLLRSLRPTPASALIHEYFNHNWRPRHLSETADFLAGHGLGWAANLTAGDAIDDLHLTPRQAAMLERTSDPVAREQLKDFLIDRGMRADLWMRAPVRRGDGACREIVAETSVMLVAPLDGLTLTATGSLGTVALADAVYKPLLAALADRVPVRIGALQARMRQSIAWPDLCEAILVLIEREVVQTANGDAASIARSRSTAQVFNAGLLAQARCGTGVDYLGSPVTGQGIKVPRLHQLFLAAEMEGLTTPEDLANAAAGVLADRQPDDLVGDARRYVRRHRPIYAALEIVPEGPCARRDAPA